MAPHEKQKKSYWTIYLIMNVHTKQNQRKHIHTNTNTIARWRLNCCSIIMKYFIAFMHLILCVFIDICLNCLIGTTNNIAPHRPQIWCRWTVSMYWRANFSIALGNDISHFVPSFRTWFKEILKIFAIIWGVFGYFHVGIQRQSHFTKFDYNSKKKIQ